jgi:hypothetical protein
MTMKCLPMIFLVVGMAHAQKEPALQKELLEMEKIDQEARKAFVKLIAEKKIPVDGKTTLDPQLAKLFAAEVEKLSTVDKKNRQRLKEIVDKYGWPTKTLVGKDGASTAWLLVQHADEELAFQKKCLKLMKDAAKDEVEAKHIAYLTDRILVAEKKKQIYGTQLDGDYKPRPIEDEKNVDKRRAEVGLSSMEEYIRITKESYEQIGGKNPKK